MIGVVNVLVPSNITLYNNGVFSPVPVTFILAMAVCPGYISASLKLILPSPASPSDLTVAVSTLLILPLPLTLDVAVKNA